MSYIEKRQMYFLFFQLEATFQMSKYILIFHKKRYAR